MSLELTGVHGLLKRHKLFTHKYVIKDMEVIVTRVLYSAMDISRKLLEAKVTEKR